MKGCLEALIDGLINRWMVGKIAERVDRWVDGWMAGGMDR